MSENSWLALLWRKRRAVKDHSHYTVPHLQSEIQSFVLFIHRFCFVNETPNVSSFTNVYFFPLKMCVWHLVEKGSKAVENRSFSYLKWDGIHKTARTPSLPFHTDTPTTFLPQFCSKESSSSIILYTYTKLRTPVFSVKWCYAYLYCKYVYPFCSWTVLLYLPQSQMF